MVFLVPCSGYLFSKANMWFFASVEFLVVRFGLIARKPLLASVCLSIYTHQSAGEQGRGSEWGAERMVPVGHRIIES